MSRTASKQVVISAGPLLSKPPLGRKIDLAAQKRERLLKSRAEQDSELNRVLTSLFPDPGEAEAIAALTTSDGTPFFTLKTKNALIDVLALVDQVGFEPTLAFLQDLSSVEQIVERSPLLEEARLQLQLEDKLLQEDKETVVEGVYKCASCGCKKVAYTARQTRSADETETVFCRCTECGKTFRG